MMPPSNFKEIKNRDAWSSIRGFVYQVDYTILRWFELQTNDLLELERGEDIDVIQHNLLNQEVARDLEQVKYRESSITLNTDLVLELLWNFYTHKINNPGHHLRFRFLTNAEYGHERPAIFTNGDKGIDRWSALQQAEYIEANDDTAIELKKHIQKKIEEYLIQDDGKLTVAQQTSNDTWHAFSNYLEDQNNLYDFIQTFEWAEQKEDKSSIAKAVLLKISEGYGEQDSNSIYERLFLFVFKLLSTHGVKQLDVPTRKQQCELKSVSHQDQALLELLRSILQQVDDRLLYLEDKTEEHAVAITNIFSDIEMMKKDTVVSFRLKNLSIVPPELITNGSLRAKKVDGIIDLFRTCSWVSLKGINGSGKSQLASLVARRFPNVFWLDLREYHDDLKTASLVMELFLGDISGMTMQPDRKSWIDQIISGFQEHTLIVFNDLPKLDGSVPRMNELICFLANTIHKGKVKLITTSNHNLPLSITQASLANCIASYIDIEFDDEEISEYLANSGAEPSFMKMAPFIAARAHRNPLMITAMISHLKSINWGVGTDQLIEVVMNKEFAAGILEDVQQSIKQYIVDEEARELLYRLSLISWIFGPDQIKAVSEAAKVVNHPNEKFQTLLHLWIQAQGNQKFEISPLIVDIGIQNLTSDVVKKVQVAIGESIIANTVDQITAIRAILAFVNGKDFNSAGMVLLKMYQATQSKEHTTILYGWGYMFYWTDTDFPREMNLGLQVLIRNEQLRLYKLIDKDTSVLLEKTKNLFDHPDGGVSEGVVIRMMVMTMHFMEISLDDYFTNLRYVLENSKEIGQKFNFDLQNNGFENLVWIPVVKLKSKQDIATWITHARQALAVGIDIFDGDVGINTIPFFCQEILDQEKNGTNSTRRDQEIEKLNLLLEFFLEMKNEYYAALIVRELVKIESLWFHDTENSQNVTKHYLTIFTTEDAKFLLSANLGKIYRDLNNNEKEIEWFRCAISYSVQQQVDYIDILIFAACAVSNVDRQEAVEYCEQAVLLADTITDYPELSYIVLLAELVIAHWLNGDYLHMFPKLEDLIARLVNGRKENFGGNWIRLFSLTGHITGYFAGMLNDGKPPQTSGSDYFAPYQGLLMFNFNDFSGHYKAENDSYILTQMAYISAAIKNPDKAYHWSLKAFDMARKNGSQAMLFTVSSVSAHFALINFKPDEAFEAYLYSSAVSSHLNGTPQQKHEVLKTSDATKIFSEKPSQEWSDAEDTATSFAIVPLFIMVLTAQMDNRLNKNQLSESYYSMITAYMPNASDKVLFSLLLEISKKILGQSISIKMLTDRANTFGHQGRRNLQTMCIIGVIYLTKLNTERLGQLINVVPALRKYLITAKGVVEYALVPFVRAQVLDIIKSYYVGSQDELSKIESEIYAVDGSDSLGLQKILKIAFETIEIIVPADRKQWLDGMEI